MLRVLFVACAPALLAGCFPEHAMPPEEALAECIRAGRVPSWKSTRETQAFSCDPIPTAQPPATAKRAITVRS